MSEILTRKLMRGEIYYVHQFPTSGSEQHSGRPAIIVSNDICNTTSKVVEVVYLTLRDKPPLPTHVFIDRGPCINSTVLCEQITSVDVDRIGDYMCRIPEHLEEALDKALMISLALPVPQTTEVTTPKLDISTRLSAAEDANTVIKDKYVALQQEYTHLQEVCLQTEEKLDKATTYAAECEQYKFKAEMYERMYNDLLDRLISRGVK